MSAVAVEEPRLLHALPGRLRVQLPWWSGQHPRQLEAQLRQMSGVRSVQANALTGNILISYDAKLTGQQAILDALRAPVTETSEAGSAEAQREAPEQQAARSEPSPAAPHVLHERNGHARRARVSMRGLDRNPELARQVVERLERRPGVRAHASQLTGRVLIEYTEHEADLDDLISEITGMELPDTPGEDHPAHPLDPAPLIQSASRVLGAGLGLSVLASRRALNIQEPVIPGFTAVSAIIGILQGFPFVRNELRRLLGRNLADVALSVPGIISLTLSGNPVGLALTLADATRLWTEVMQRRDAWKGYSERIKHAPSDRPGAAIRLEAGEHAPRAAKVIEGTGVAIGSDGLPTPAAPGELLPVGAQVFGGPVTVELQAGNAFRARKRPVPVAKSLYDRYTEVLGPLSLGYAALTAITTRSFSRTLAALLLVNPRAALVGLEGADLSASARVLRAGVIEVGTRPERTIRRPDLLLIDGPRVITDRLEVLSVLPLSEGQETGDLLNYASGIAAAAGFPWGNVFPLAGRAPASDGAFDGRTASALLNGVQYTLGPASDDDPLPTALRLRHRGDYLLVLRKERAAQPLGVIALRPHLAAGVQELVHTCHQHGVEVELLSSGNPITAQNLARRAQLSLVSSEDSVEMIRARQTDGALVAFLSDNAYAAAAFAACDLGIALTDGRTRFPARADLLAPDLGAVTAIIQAGAAREATVRDSVGLSAIANGVGAFWGLQPQARLENASYAVYAASFGALGDGWLRLRGGERPHPLTTRITDVRPELWGRRGVHSVLQALNTTETGLTSAQAAARRQAPVPLAQSRALLNEILAQLRSPLTAILAAGAGLSLVLGAVADVGIIGATIAANVAIGAWQSHRAGQVASALERLGAPTARVLRDGEPRIIPATELAPGDILLLAPGDRVAADGRIISAQGLEVDESALTGESLPVTKTVSEGPIAGHIVLEGSDITSGNGRAVVFAVGRQTLMGATAAALAVEETKESPLGARLSRLLSQTLPLAAIGGGIVFISGFARTRQALPQLALGATLALTAVPEGLPLLASVGEAAVARRLSNRDAVVRRLSAVEALGRVDVACTDKTGTLTEGRLALRLVASLNEAEEVSDTLPESLRWVLLTAGLASPHPDAEDAAAHPTDVAVTQGAEAAGLGAEVRAQRREESPFDPARSFHATLTDGRISVKGAPEALAPLCVAALHNGQTRAQPLDEEGRNALLATAQQLAGRGLRVLMVAEGAPDTPVENPQNLTALGFVGISDPLRPSVIEAVRRCHNAGVRVIMLTGDHPATARSIASEAGLLGSEDEIITANELAELQNGDLDERMARVTVVARATPLDKVRIIESLRRQGHTVAMTGDGVNDAPALRLADVGVAIGRSGTEVARQTADVVLVNDDFSTLV